MCIYEQMKLNIFRCHCRLHEIKGKNEKNIDKFKLFHDFHFCIALCILSAVSVGFLKSNTKCKKISHSRSHNFPVVSCAVSRKQKRQVKVGHITHHVKRLNVSVCLRVSSSTIILEFAQQMSLLDLELYYSVKETFDLFFDDAVYVRCACCSTKKSFHGIMSAPKCRPS